MYLLLGIITVCGLGKGLYSLFKISRGKGIIELIVVAILPVLTIYYCSLKESRAFGDTDWAFLVHSATIDRAPFPWILLVLLIVELICVQTTIRIMMKTR